MFVKEIMTSGVQAVTPDTSLGEIAHKMRELNLGSIPIQENGDVIGMVTDRDLVCRAMAAKLDPETTLAREIMTKDVVFCFEDQDVADAAHLMEEKHLYRLPVVTHEQKLTGMLSISDLARHAPNALSGEVLKAISVHVH